MKQNSFLFFLGHPAHFHLFKNLINDFKTKGGTVSIVIKTKDILEELCMSESWQYTNVLPTYRKNNFFSFTLSYLKKYLRISKIIRKNKPTILLGSEPTLTHLGKFFRIPSFIFSEDDVEIIPKFAKIAYPFVDVILSPKSCNAGKWKHKKIAYDGFHKFAYLHPSVFIPNRDLIKSYLPDENYFILRLTELSAYHDKNISGIQVELARKIIRFLVPYGKVYITSERKLSDEFEKYHLNLPPNLIHHALSFAKMYIGDSQSMAVESALLGTPGIRLNDFVGKIGVLNELEDNYQLTVGIHPNEEEKLFSKMDEILNDTNVSIKFMERRAKLLEEKINVPAFFTWFIENYPSSKRIMIENPVYQYNFK